MECNTHQMRNNYIPQPMLIEGTKYPVKLTKVCASWLIHYRYHERKKET